MPLAWVFLLLQLPIAWSLWLWSVIFSLNFVICEHFTNQTFKTTGCKWIYSPNANFLLKRKKNQGTVLLIKGDSYLDRTRASSLYWCGQYGSFTSCQMISYWSWAGRGSFLSLGFQFGLPVWASSLGFQASRRITWMRSSLVKCSPLCGMFSDYILYNHVPGKWESIKFILNIRIRCKVFFVLLYVYLLYILFNRPAAAGTVLHTASSMIKFMGELSYSSRFI